MGQSPGVDCRTSGCMEQVYCTPVGDGEAAGFLDDVASAESGRHAAAAGAEGSATPPARFVVSGGSVAQLASGRVKESEIRKFLREIMEHRNKEERTAEPRSWMEADVG